MYLAVVALCVALAQVDISGAQSCVGRDGQVDPRCGDCTVRGDPHIKTYDGNTYTVPHCYPFDDTYAISQLGKGYDPSFGVSSHFKKCGPGWKKNASCVSTVYYNEPGISIELILPVKLFNIVSPSSKPTALYCQTARPNDPDCATKIKVNGVTRDIPAGGSASPFRGNDRIFKVGPCNSYKCQIVVVGSNGITVSLLVEPKPPSTYYLNVYATPSLHNALFGLCGTFTGTGTDHYTLRDGSEVTLWSEANIQQFIESWKTSRSHNILLFGPCDQGFGQQGSGQQGSGQRVFIQQGFTQQGFGPQGFNPSQRVGK